MKELAEPFLDKQRGITADNFFSSRQLALYLLQQRDTTFLGTARKIRREVLGDFTDERLISRRPPGSSEYVYSGDVTMLSYIPKPRRSVILLSSQHHGASDGVNKRGKTEPTMILDYNRTKGIAYCTCM